MVQAVVLLIVFKDRNTMNLASSIAVLRQFAATIQLLTPSVASKKKLSYCIKKKLGLRNVKHYEMNDSKTRLLIRYGIISNND